MTFRPPALKPARLRMSLLRRVRRAAPPRRAALAAVALLAVLLACVPFVSRLLPSRPARPLRPAPASAPASDARRIRSERNAHPRAILMSCPAGPSHTNRGAWKPSNMIRGVEGVVRQMARFNSALPLFFGYYPAESARVHPWCTRVKRQYGPRLTVVCFQIPEPYPTGLYGYAKIFAIRHAPADHVLWLDCDVFPVRALDPLFHDPEFRISRAMFWPDSRDYFDELKALHFLQTPTARQMFPPHSWWVRQGFDSGLVLLDRKSCATQIEELCTIARTPTSAAIRRTSMGDKDIFHVVWMRHERNFTLVPFIGETGNIQTALKSAKSRLYSSRRIISAARIAWQMSSQVKHGRDGQVYALHQLHKQQRFALIATLSRGTPFHSPRVTRSTSHVKPFIVARLDLRHMRPGYKAKSTVVGDFVSEVEDALIRPGNRIVRTGMESASDELRRPYGLVVKRAPDWLHAAASEMASSWHHGLDTDAAAKAIYSDHRKKLVQQQHVKGRFKKDIYRRMLAKHRIVRTANGTRLTT